MAASLQRQLATGRRRAVQLGQADKLTVSDPSEVVAVQLLEQTRGESREDILMQRTAGQVGQFLRVRLQIEQLDAISRGVIDQLEATVKPHDLPVIEFTPDDLMVAGALAA